MIIQETYQAIEALSRIIPDAYLFVMDTTDRSFIFQSKMRNPCEGMILRLEEEQGFDRLVSNRGHYFINNAYKAIGLKRLSMNTYLGFCMDAHCTSSIQRAKQVVIPENVD